MEFVYAILFLVLLPLIAWLVAIIAGARKLSLLGKAVLLLPCFAALRYFVIPLWTPDATFWQYVKAICEVLVLHGLSWQRGSRREEKPEAGAGAKEPGLLPRLVFRIFFVGCVYLAFYDVISVWPVFGQIWYWVYVIALSAFASVNVESWAKERRPGLRYIVRSCIVAATLACISIATLVYFVCCIVSSDYRHSVNDGVEDLVLALCGEVAKAMPDISNTTFDLMEIWDEALKADRAFLDKQHPKTAEVRSRAAVKRSLAELRDMLLPIDSQVVLLNIRRFDIKIASQREDLAKLRERRGLHPEKAEALDAKISKAEEVLNSLEAARAEALEKTRADLKAIGLDFPEKSPFLLVDLDNLIDNAIVAKNTGIVVDNLKSIVEAERGNSEAAKRYYGAYVVLLEVQSECFRQYLAKAATGIWRKGVENIENEASNAIYNNLVKAQEEGRTEEERVAFSHAAQTNRKTLAAAQAYLMILDRHEAAVKEKLAAVEERHGVALSLWESVDIAGSFSDQIVADSADFEALIELKLPELSFVDNDALQAEFDSITRQLSKEE